MGEVFTRQSTPPANPLGIDLATIIASFDADIDADVTSYHYRHGHWATAKSHNPHEYWASRHTPHVCWDAGLIADCRGKKAPRRRFGIKWRGQHTPLPEVQSGAPTHNARNVNVMCAGMT